MFTLTVKHLALSASAVAVGTAIAIPVGLYLGHKRAGEFAAINASNVGRAIPTLVLLTVFIAYIGVGFIPIMLALALLALPPILTNTWVAVTQVERDNVDAARGMGMTEGEIIRQVELPLSLPTIFAGIRVAAVNVVATATIAPLGSVDSLGTPIIAGNVVRRRRPAGRGHRGERADPDHLRRVGGAAAGGHARGTEVGGGEAAEAPPAQTTKEGSSNVMKSRFLPLAILAALMSGARPGRLRQRRRRGRRRWRRRQAASGELIEKIPGAESKPTITVGSKNFTEQYILGNIYADALSAAGFKVKKSLDLGSEVVAYKALKQGEVDAYPEYTGTALTAFFKVPVQKVPKEKQAAFDQVKTQTAKERDHRPAAHAVREHLPAGDEQGAQEKLGKPKTTSDLKGKTEDLKISGFPECKKRIDCLLGVEQTYGLKFGGFVASEEKYDVIENGSADVIFGFTTDGELTTGKYVTVDDDKTPVPALQRLAADAQRDVQGDRARGPEGHRGRAEAAHREGDGRAELARRPRQAGAGEGREGLPPRGRLHQVVDARGEGPL